MYAQPDHGGGQPEPDHGLRRAGDRRPNLPPHLLAGERALRHFDERRGRPERSSDVQPGGNIDVIGHRDRSLLPGSFGPQLLDHPQPSQRCHRRRLPDHAGRGRLAEFRRHAIKNLSVYNNPDGINGILAYTAVPATDVNDAGSLSTPPLIPGSTRHRLTPASRSAMRLPRSKGRSRSITC